MPSRRKTTPSYLFHKQSGRARAVWTDSLGIRQQKLLPGLFDSEVSRTAHARLALELAAMPTIAVKSATLTVQEVLLAYHEHATTYYGDGKELDAISRCIRAVRLIYGDTLAAEFGPAKLKVVRQSIVDAGLCRKQVNKRVDRIRRAFRWAVGEELVPTSVYEGLRALAPLMPGRSGVKEGTPRKPADPAAVEKVLPLLPPGVRAVVKMLRITGARPTEILTMRPADLDRKGEVWTYTPVSHKGTWKGRNRTIHIGRDAQAVLSPWLLGTPPEGFIWVQSVSKQDQ